MKKLIIVFISIIILQSCGASTESLLIKKWKADEKSMKKGLEGAGLNPKKIVTGLVRNKVNGMMDIHLEFKADKTVELKIFKQSLIGKWELNEEGDIKEIKIDGLNRKFNQTIRIKSVTADKLILTGFSYRGFNLSNKEVVLVPSE